jgi:NitT/TauT family transport system substrate-binding protein
MARWPIREHVGVWSAVLALLALTCAPAAGDTRPTAPPAEALGRAAPAAEPPPAPIRLAVAVASVGGSSLPLWVAREAGLFERHGLQVETQVLPGTRATQALAAGEVQVSTGDVMTVAAAVLNGLDLAIIATPIPTLLYKIMAQPSIPGPEALRGARFGITTRGSSTEYTARQVLARWGYEPERDVVLLELRDQPGLLAGLQGGAIDLGVMGSPTQQMAARLGFKTLLAVGELGLEFGLGTISTRRADLAVRRDVYLRFLQGYVEAVQRMKRDPEFAIAVAAQVNKLEDRELLEDYYTTYARYTRTVPLTPVGAVQAALDQLALELPAARTASAAALIDNSLLEELQASGRLPRAE